MRNRAFSRSSSLIFKPGSADSAASPRRRARSPPYAGCASANSARSAAFSHTRAAAAYRQGRRLTTIVTESKSGREAWSAPVFIDTTGDGDLGAQALEDHARVLVLDLVQHDDELLAAITVALVVFAQGRAQDVGEGEQDLVAYQVAVGVVDALELVEVEDGEEFAAIGLVAAPALDARREQAGELALESWTCTPRKPVAPMWIVELARPASMLWAIDRAVEIGMA